MALDLEGYYGAAQRISSDLRDSGHDLGTALVHGGHKLKKYKAEQRAQGKKLGLLGFGLLPKWFGHEGYTADAPMDFSEYKLKHGTPTSTQEDYTGFLANKYGGSWDPDGESATRQVYGDEGTIAANRRQRKEDRIERREERRLARQTARDERKEARQTRRDERREAFRTNILDPLKEDIKGQFKGLLDLTAKGQHAPSPTMTGSVSIPRGGTAPDPNKKGIEDLVKAVPGALKSIPAGMKKGLANFALNREMRKRDKVYGQYATNLAQSIGALPDDPIFRGTASTGFNKLSEKSAYAHMENKFKGAPLANQAGKILSDTSKNAEIGSLRSAHGRIYLKKVIHEAFGAKGDESTQNKIKFLVDRYKGSMSPDYYNELQEIINRYNI